MVCTLTFSACDSINNNHIISSTLSTLNEPLLSYALLGPLSDANVTVTRVSDNLQAYTTKTKAYTNEIKVLWPQNRVGSFEVDINSSFLDEDLMLVKVNKGIDIDENDDGIIDSSSFSPMKGTLCAYSTLKELKSDGIHVNVFTTLASLEILPDDNSSIILEKLSSYARKIFRLSLNSDSVIDYKDLNAFVPNYTDNSNFVNPKIYKQIYDSGFIKAILNDENLTLFKKQDIDSDGLTWEEEVLFGSSVLVDDSDGDGLLDGDEYTLGLNPNNRDTDFDNISDYDEINGVTNPLKSDSDDDYFSDSYEMNHGTNPLVSDEDNNGVLDGLDGDPLFKYQWYLKSNGDIVSNTNNVATILGNDLNIFDVYHYQRGDENSTIIQVIDTGVELIHEDLNIDSYRSYNSINKTNNPTATRHVSAYDKVSPFEIGHGTAVAGIIGAIANNGVGVRGVVPNAKIAGSNWLEEQSIYELDNLWYSGKGANEILVSNNSWGAYMSKDKSFEEILQLSSEQLRDGKGRIFTFASGNERKRFGNSNLSYIANNRYAITVASLDHDNKFSDYSNPGSNILVSAYGGSAYEKAPTIATALLTGKSYYQSELGSNLGAITFDDDLKRSYTFAMNGTSAATPMVSGAIALTLESCPDLTWRDVKWLISYTAKKIDVNDTEWVMNSAGRSHNINYGYGLIDTNRMIQECRSPYYKLLPQEIVDTVSLENINVYIPDNNISKNIDIVFQSEYIVEWVELIVDSNHPYAGDYEIDLISPYGTTTKIITPNELRSDYYKGGFRFSSAAFMGEHTQGKWRVSIVDRLKPDSGTISNIILKIYGHERS